MGVITGAGRNAGICRLTDRRSASLTHITNKQKHEKRKCFSNKFFFNHFFSLVPLGEEEHVSVPFLSLPSFSCFPKPQTMLLTGEMSHALKLLFGFG